MVYRVYSEKKKEFAHEANALLSDARRLLGIGGLTGVRVINRYDAEGIRPDLFEYAKTTVFSEPQVDVCSEAPDLDGARVFAVEFLPGQFDQRAVHPADLPGGKTPHPFRQGLRALRKRK